MKWLSVKRNYRMILVFTAISAVATLGGLLNRGLISVLSQDPTGGAVLLHITKVMLANYVWFAPFIVSFVRNKGHHWTCLAILIIPPIVAGFIYGVSNGAINLAFASVWVPWVIALIVSTYGMIDENND